MNSQTKALEKFCVALLQKAIPTLPQGEPEGSESPDVILATDAGQIGIEVTRLFKSADAKGQLLQVQESERSLMVKEAMRLYETMGKPPVEVHVDMAGQTQFNKANRNHFARILSNLVASHVPNDRSWKVVENDFDDPDVFPHEIDSISIARYGHDRNYWSVPDTWWVQEEFIPELQSAIDKKNVLLRQYNPVCTAHWLLIVIEGVSGSTGFEPSQKTLNHVYTTDFQRLFLLERTKVKAFELRHLGAA